MHSIDRAFFILAVLLGLAGMLLGIQMGMAHDFRLVPVHTHVNLVGWVSLALFGIGYRVGLAKGGGLAVLHFWIALAGAILLPVGIYLAVTQEQQAVVIIGSLFTLASMVLFLVNVLRARTTPAG
ncbi:cbb3-type cytochrome c oxidase subunit I [Inquilinus sp. Marseille-Q2685]|uniref:cbb3-type cytochrome c oxidase subunit I n=1 Tax=Inquilinus sp. Marseille-Q2685 TaxID=2866581 RepID=UPI001CE3FB09|nr:cbb3-type cytochrome c oxidase subunit I [Inquilinus sp. Marseille-Q2685]